MDSLSANYSPSPLETLQLDLAGRLESDAFFADIPVTVMRPRGQESFATIQTRIDQALAGVRKKANKAGASVFVAMATADATDSNAPGPRLDFEIMVRVEEVPTINMGPSGTRKSCEEIALRVAQLGHLFNPGRGNVLYCAPQALTPQDNDAGKVIIDVTFRQKCGVEGLGKVSTPSFAPFGGAALQEVAMVCATDGATIYYTTNGTLPCSANPDAQTYTAPFIAEAGVLRAAAEKSGYAASDVRQATFL